MKEIIKVHKKTASPSYLYLIGNIYYFRYRLPKKFHPYLGKKEVRINLASAYLLQARKRACICYAQVQNYLEGLEMPRAKNKSIPQLSLDNSQEANKNELTEALDLAWRATSSPNVPSSQEIFGSKNKLEKFFSAAEQNQPLLQNILTNTDFQNEDNFITQFEKKFPYCFDFDAENKIIIDSSTIEKRMHGLLRFLLDADRDNLKARPTVYSIQEIFAGQIMVDSGEEINRIEYLKRYENLYRHFVNNKDAIIDSMEGFERFLLYTHPAVLEKEITKENILYVINEYCKIMVTYYQILQARTSFDFSKEKSVLLQDYIPYPPEFAPVSITAVPHVKDIALPHNNSSNLASAVNKSSVLSNEMKMSEFIDIYISYKLSDEKWRNEAGAKNHRLRLNFLIEILGDIPITSIDHTHRRKFFETLKKLPRRTRAQKFQGKTVHELVLMENEEKLAPKMINIILQSISGMFTWAINEGMINVNPFKGLSVPDNRNQKDLKEAFTADDLQKIFSSKALQDERTSQRPSRFWMPYIALYSGMRLNEIGQIYVEDIKKYSENESDYWYIDVTAQNGEDKSLKAKYSERIVPIHNRLIEMGFLDFVEKQKKAKHKRIFPELTLTASKGRYGHEVSNFFSSFLHKEKIEGKKSFHSFRHTFVNFFEKKDLMSNAFRQVLGHGQEDLASSQYGAKFTVKECYDRVIKHLDFGV